MMRYRKAIAFIILMSVVVFVVGCKTNQRSVANDKNTFNGHAYVDLGLPSGTLWATCNVGAKNPHDYGDYFAWGETVPKANYSNSTYKFSKAKIHGGYTKYSYRVEDGYNGYVDKLTTLEPKDDAATVNWGSGWRMPTKEECEELLRHTTKKFETIHGVKGTRFTGPNGQSVFLPATGNRVNEKLLHDGNEGSYWSSSLYTVVSAAWLFYCDCGSEDCDMFDFGIRETGRAVRPVCSALK